LTRRRLFDPTPPRDGPEPPAPLWKKLVWFFGLAAAASATTAAVAYALRALLLSG
jgi:hypothetical protein